MTRVLLLNRYSAQGASSRLRTLQYLPELRRQGFVIEAHSLLGDSYLSALYQSQPAPRADVLKAYLQRMALLLRARQFDVLWIEKELFPWLPDLFELLAAGRPQVVDYDDAVFHRYDNHPSNLVRSLLGRKLDRIMRRAACVVAGNRYIADHAQTAGARRVAIVPTSVDATRYLPAVPAADRDFVVGWIGTPQTAHFLLEIRQPLQQFHALGGVKLVFVGAPDNLDLGVPYSAPAWSEATEVEEIRRFSCGVMPLTDGPFERGKSGYKLIQYMACSLPVVASPVGANRDIVAENQTGFLPGSAAGWLSALTRLKADPALSARYGNNGRKLVEEKYNSAENVKVLAGILREAVESPR